MYNAGERSKSVLDQTFCLFLDLLGKATNCRFNGSMSEAEAENEGRAG
jgi:hypothetical protein